MGGGYTAARGLGPKDIAIIFIDWCYQKQNNICLYGQDKVSIGGITNNLNLGLV